MNSSSRRIVIIAAGGTGLLIARAALPKVLTWLANLGVREIPGYRGRVQKVTFNFTVPSLVIRGLSLAKFSGNKSEQLLDISSLIVGSQWRKILTGALVGYIRVDSPRLLLDLENFEYTSKLRDLNAVAKPRMARPSRIQTTVQRPTRACNRGKKR
jgi:hypothetical protein